MFGLMQRPSSSPCSFFLIGTALTLWVPICPWALAHLVAHTDDLSLWLLGSNIRSFLIFPWSLPASLKKKGLVLSLCVVSVSPLPLCCVCLSLPAPVSISTQPHSHSIVSSFAYVLALCCLAAAACGGSRSPHLSSSGLLLGWMRCSIPLPPPPSLSSLLLLLVHIISTS